MIASLRLQNFRSYQDSSFEFSNSVNIIVGPNASGKTNILEGLVYVCRGTAFRALDRENIRRGETWARLDGLTTANQMRTIKLTHQGNLVQREVLLDDVAKKRLPVFDTIPVVLFEPDDLQLLTTSPDRRRSFLDTILSQTDPEFARHQKAYVRALAQRNRLLKSGRGLAKDTMFVWNIRLSELGGQLVTKRLELIDKLNQGLDQRYSKLANKKHRVSVAYQSTLPPQQYASEMLKQLELKTDKDMLRGFTSVGPHRDDIEITINDTPIHHHASRGETRTTLLSLKIQETSLLETVRGIKPLLLLDDVFSELDGARRKALTSFVKDYQSFITTTDADVVQHGFTQQTNIITMG